MPRKVVPLVTGEIYHVYNRGVDKRNIFENKGDYLRFYASLKHFNCEFPVGSLRDVPKNGDAPKPLVSIIAYAMLPNHFHLLIKQVADNGLSEFMKRVLGGYTTHFNENNNRSGSLFQGSYKRIHVVSDDYYKYLFSYIN